MPPPRQLRGFFCAFVFMSVIKQPKSHLSKLLLAACCRSPHSTETCSAMICWATDLFHKVAWRWFEVERWDTRVKPFAVPSVAHLQHTVVCISIDLFKTSRHTTLEFLLCTYYIQTWGEMENNGFTWTRSTSYSLSPPILSCGFCPQCRYTFVYKKFPHCQSPQWLFEGFLPFKFPVANEKMTFWIVFCKILNINSSMMLSLVAQGCRKGHEDKDWLAPLEIRELIRQPVSTPVNQSAVQL